MNQNERDQVKRRFEIEERAANLVKIVALCRDLGIEVPTEADYVQLYAAVCESPKPSRSELAAPELAATSTARNS